MVRSCIPGPTMQRQAGQSSGAKFGLMHVSAMQYFAVEASVDCSDDRERFLQTLVSHSSHSPFTWPPPAALQQLTLSNQIQIQIHIQTDTNTDTNTIAFIFNLTGTSVCAITYDAYQCLTHVDMDLVSIFIHTFIHKFVLLQSVVVPKKDHFLSLLLMLQVFCNLML